MISVSEILLWRTMAA